MKKIYLLLAFIFVLQISCNRYKNEVISHQTIDKAWEAMQKDNSLTDLEKVFFESLYYMNKDRKEYLKWLVTLSEGTKMEDFDEILVSEDDFEHLSKRIFSVLTSNQKTYKQVLTEIVEATELTDMYANKLILVYNQIDSVCNQINNEGKLSFKYTSPEKLFGYCPFLPDNHPYYIEAEKIRQERDSEIERRFPILSKVRKLEGELYLGY